MQRPGPTGATETVRRRPPPYDPAAPWRATKWHVDGTPMRWDAANPITWAFNTTELVQKIIELTETAMLLIAEASGLTIVQTDMVTSSVNDAVTGPERTEAPQILISCVTPEQLPGPRNQIADRWD